MRMLLRRVTSSLLFSFAAVVACCNFVTGSDKIMFDTDNKKIGGNDIFIFILCFGILTLLVDVCLCCF